jgi:hypothetical protein
MYQAPPWIQKRPLLLAVLLIQPGLFGCNSDGVGVILPTNQRPIVDSLIALPDTIGPSDSTVVTCFAWDPDGDSLVYDWQTDSRLLIQGNPPWNRFLNQQHSPSHTFYNANLSNPINDSAWVYCKARDPWGGGAGRRVFIILRPR